MKTFDGKRVKLKEVKVDESLYKSFSREKNILTEGRLEMAPKIRSSQRSLRIKRGRTMALIEGEEDEEGKKEEEVEDEEGEIERKKKGRKWVEEERGNVSHNAADEKKGVTNCFSLANGIKEK